MKLSVLRIAFPRTLPVMVGYLTLGTAFGLLLQDAGFGLPWAALMSILIYAGSAQFLGVSLLSAAASLPQAALLTGLLNFRHFFYGLSMVERYQNAQKKKAYLTFSLTDETYALLSSGGVPEGVPPTDYYFTVSLLHQCYWVSGSLFGNVAGSLLPFDTTGVDFAMTALFVVLAVEQWKSHKKHTPALCGLCCGVLSLILFGSDLFLIPALLAIASLLLLMRRQLSAEKSEVSL